MSKKIVAFIIALPALAVLFIFKIIPTFQMVSLSFKKYDMFKGIRGSESAGLDNYLTLLVNGNFTDVIKNTVWLSVLSIVFTCVLAVLLIICISRMSGRVLKTIAIVLIAIPAFIPATSFAGVFMDLFSVDGVFNQLCINAGAEPILFYARPVWYPFLFAVMDAIRNLYIPVIIGVLVCERKGGSRTGKVGATIIGYIAARAMLLLSPDIESILLTSNPLNRETSDVVDTFIYRTGLITFNMSVAGAAWTVKAIAQLIISVIFFFVLYMIIPRITDFVGELEGKAGTMGESIIGIIGFILFGAGSVIMIGMAFMPKGDGFSKAIGMLLKDGPFMAAVTNSFIYGLISCILFGIVTLMLSFPLNVSKVFYPLLLIIFISLGGNVVGEFLMFQTMGMVNTRMPIVLSSAFSVVGAFMLHFSVSVKLKGMTFDILQYLKAALAPLAVIVVLAFITSWGSFYYQNIYVSSQTGFGVGMYGYQLMIRAPALSGEAAANGVCHADMQAAYMFVSSVIPAALGVILISLNKYLPLTALSAHMRKI